LKLAAASSEGIVRVYEAMDPVNLSSWTPIEEFHVNGVENQSLSNPNETEVRYCLSWCPSYVPSGYLAASTGTFNSVKIFQNEGNNWNSVLTLDGHQGIVNDVAWANTMGRSYHLIATACHDFKVRIYQITLPGKSDGLSTLPPSPQSANEQHQTLASGSPTPQPSLLTPRHTAQLVAEFGDHQAPVWRVKWNLTGTVLSSAGDDGKIRLWKSNYSGVWRCISSVSLDNNVPSSSSMHNNPVASGSISITNSQNNMHSMNAIPLPGHD
jgi:nucleoporin SEH1